MTSKRLTKGDAEAFARRVIKSLPELKFNDVTAFVNEKFRPYRHPQVQALIDAGLGECLRTSEIWNANCRYYVLGAKLPEGTYLPIEKRAKELYQENDKIAQERRDMERQLALTAASCRTVRALKEMFPELEEFMPSDEPIIKKQLPANNLVAELMKNGLKLK